MSESTHPSVALRRSGILLAASALVVWLEILPGRHLVLAQVALLFGPPVAASAGMALMGSAAPSLYGDARRWFPECLTLPLVHASLVVVIVALGTTTEAGIRKPSPHFEPILAWLDLSNLALTALAQAILLCADVGLVRRTSSRARGGSR